MIAIASCWPPSVAAGSGTTVSQNGLVQALACVGVEAELLYTSRFATNFAELEARRLANAALGPELDRYEAVLGIDGEGWLWAPKPRRAGFVAFCEAVLVEVVPFEAEPAASVLRRQASWEAAAAQVADAVVARSAFAAQRVSEGYGIDPAGISVLPVPFDLDGWRKALPALPREPLVLAVGHAYPRKNYRLLLEAWRLVIAQRPDARLVIVGEGPETPVLKRMAAELPSVFLAGHVPFAALRSLYARATVFCHPSLQENFGIAVVEGLACGAGVVTHRHPAVLENTAGLAGVWTVDASQPEALAAALLEALAQPAPWPDSRLAELRRKLHPAAVGQQLKAILERLR